MTSSTSIASAVCYCEMTSHLATEIRQRIGLLHIGRLTDALSLLRGRISEIPAAPASETLQALAIYFIKHLAPELARFCGHWAPGFLLQRLVGVRDWESDEAQELLDCFIAEVLARRLASGRSEPLLDYGTLGAKLFAFVSGVKVHLFPGRSFKGRVPWALVADALDGGRVCTLTDGGETGPPGESCIHFIPFAISDSWGVPVVEGDNPLAPGLGAMDEEMHSALAQERASLIGLADGLRLSHALLAKVWPEVVPWVKLLVPAFIDLGEPAYPTLPRSCSFGPGTPIFISSVGYGFLYAEALIHELQHQRFHLCYEKASIMGDSDSRSRFASLWRTDPRPLSGLLLALHAFLAVNELRIRSLDGGGSDFLDERLISRIVFDHKRNLFAFRSLAEFSRLSPTGVDLVRDLASVLVQQDRRIANLEGEDDAIDSYISTHLSRLRQRHAIENGDKRLYDWHECLRCVHRALAQ